MALDLTEISDLVDKLEWLSYELKGSGVEPGLLEKLNNLIKAIEGADTPGSEGFIKRVEKLTSDIQRVIDQQSQLATVILRPVSETHRKSIIEAVDSGFQDGRQKLMEEIADCSKGALLATEKITSATAQADILFRGQQESLRSAQDQLNKSSVQVAQQLRQMLEEMKESINVETLQEPLRKALEKTLASSALEVNKAQLTDAWNLVAADLVKQFRNEMMQHREGMEDIFRESQAEQIRRVKDIINGRTPSQAIVTLYDDLDATKAKLQVKEKQHANLLQEFEKKVELKGSVNTKLIVASCFASFIAGMAFVYFGFLG